MWVMKELLKQKWYEIAFYSLGKNAEQNFLKPHLIVIFIRLSGNLRALVWIYIEIAEIFQPKFEITLSN